MLKFWIAASIGRLHEGVMFGAYHRLSDSLCPPQIFASNAFQTSSFLLTLKSALLATQRSPVLEVPLTLSAVSYRVATLSQLMDRIQWIVKSISSLVSSLPSLAMTASNRKRPSSKFCDSVSNSHHLWRRLLFSASKAFSALPVLQALACHRCQGTENAYCSDPVKTDNFKLMKSLNNAGMPFGLRT